jgi:hypothetical protein
MADNLTTQSATPATIPASSVIATDDAGAGGHVQVVKLAISTNGSATPLTADNTDGMLVNLGANNDVTVTGTVSVTGVSTAANQSTANTALSAIQTAVEVIDNFISGSKGLVTEDNSAAILTALQTIDNFISGARGLVTEDNSAAIKTAVEIIDNFISGSRGLVTEDNSAAALTALQLIDDMIAVLGTATYTEASTKGAVVGAVRRDADTTLVDTTNEIGPLQMDANGRLKVEAFSGETLPVSLASVPSHAVTNAGTFVTQIDGTALTRLTDTETNTASGAVVGNGAAATAQRVTLANDSTGIVALTTSTASIGKLAANSGVDIGDVDVTSLPALAAGTNNIGDVDIASIAAGDNNIGNVDVVTLPALPAGTNAIGKLAANDGVDIGDVTLTAGTNAIGKLLPPNVDVTTHTLYAKKYYTNAGAVTDGIVWSPASGTRWHVVSMFINVSAAATVTFEDDKAGGDEAIMKMELAANSGMTINFGELYPLASGEDAADLIVTTSAGNIYVTITGYEV